MNGVKPAVSNWERRLIRSLAAVNGACQAKYAPSRGRAGAIRKGFVVESGEMLLLTPTGRSALAEGRAT